MDIRRRSTVSVEDAQTQAKIVLLYRDHGLSLEDLRARYRIGDKRLKAILEQGGVTVENYRRPQAGALDAA